MPDSLDPTDVFLSGITGTWMRLGCFALVSLGGHAVGSLIHDAPTNIAAIQSSGLAALPSIVKVDPGEIALSWIGIMVGSVASFWTIPFLLLFLRLLVSLWLDGDLFKILFTLALSQPVHTFAVLHCWDKNLAGSDLALAVGLLIVVDVAIAALILWWRHTSENAPDPPEPDPEL
jgi:hypothetical protein